MFFSWSWESSVWFSLSPQLTGASIVFLKKLLTKQKLARFLFCTHANLCEFLVGKGNESSHESRHLPSLAIQQRCWLFTSMISNWVGRRHTKSARKPWTGQPARISPWFTWHNRETDDQTNGNSLYCCCFNCNSNAIIFVLIPVGHKENATHGLIFPPLRSLAEMQTLSVKAHHPQLAPTRAEVRWRQKRPGL